MRVFGLILALTYCGAALAGEWPAPRAPQRDGKSRLVACPEFGAGYFRVGDTSTCLKISGYVEADVVYHGGAANDPSQASKSSHGK